MDKRYRADSRRSVPAQVDGRYLAYNINVCILISQTKLLAIFHPCHSGMTLILAAHYPRTRTFHMTIVSQHARSFKSMS